MVRLRKMLVFLVAATLLAAGFYYYAQWRHERDIESRLDALTPLIVRYSRTSNLSPALVRAVIRVESGGRPEARSPKDARGLMQITPITEQEMLRRLRIPQASLYDPEYNVRLGAAYLRVLMDRFHGDRWLVLAAYNAGPTRMADYVSRSPELTGEEIVRTYAPSETRNYCDRVLALAQEPWEPEPIGVEPAPVFSPGDVP